ncbi:MAG: RNA polymerase factor sigma-54 [Burkholderiaceae bacterium]
MKQVLQLKLSQHLALTPQLQQSIRLLQLSTLELNQEIEQVLTENPLLERADDPFTNSLRLSGDGTLKSERYESDAPVSEAADGRGQDESEGPSAEAGTGEGNLASERDFGSDWSSSDGGRRNASSDDEMEMPQLAAVPTSLRDHLLAQLSVTKLSRRDHALVSVLIEAIDEDGYLRQPLEEIAEFLPTQLEVEAEELTMALNLIQSFDPPGVGARNASECLALQLRPEAGNAAMRADRGTRELAVAIVREHLELLAAHDFTKLKRLLRCDDNALRAAHSLIRNLTPFPGRAFLADDVQYVVPDVIVRKVKGAWRATLNPDVMPQLRINRMYAQILREHRGTEQAASLAARLQEARWLIKNVQQRFDTILRVSEAIVERQRNFFTHGEVAMRPLVLREIADTLGLHESTVSRVTTQKYMLSPMGTFELKYFFGSHVATEAGGAASSTAIRALIRQLIGAEDPKKPLSDSKIAEMLGEQGIVVARRTIAKYREALRIPPVSLRKSL